MKEILERLEEKLDSQAKEIADIRVAQGKHDTIVLQHERRSTAFERVAMIMERRLKRLEDKDLKMTGAVKVIAKLAAGAVALAIIVEGVVSLLEFLRKSV